MASRHLISVDGYVIVEAETSAAAERLVVQFIDALETGEWSVLDQAGVLGIAGWSFRLAGAGLLVEDTQQRLRDWD